MLPPGDRMMKFIENVIQSLPVSDPVLVFCLVMLMVLVAPLIARKIRLPDIVGLIIAGMIAGPYVIGLLARDNQIQLLGTIGILYIMFQAGLEINLEQVKQNKHYTLVFGLITFSIPLFVGTAAGLFVLGMGFLAAVLLASMFSSHTLLTFPMVSKMGLAKKRSVTTAIGGTIITDSLAFLVLAVVIAANRGDLSALFWFRLIVSIIIFVFIIIVFLPKISSWFFKNFTSETGVEEYAFVLTALFVSAYLSYLAGLEPIIGAFLAGLTLNSFIPEKSSLMNRIQFVGNSLFIPFFLISVGMLINPAAFVTDTYAITVSGVMIFCGIVTKLLAASLTGSILKFSGTEQGVLYGMSVNQAAATLAAVMIGYRIGLFDESIVTGTILMIIVTTLAGSFITQIYSRKLVLSSKDIQDYSIENIVDRILVPISSSDQIKWIMEFSFLLHSKSSHEPIYPLHVVLEGGNEKQQIIESEKILTKANVLASNMRKDVIPLTKIDVNVSSAIKKAVNEHRISKIILGWKDGGKYSLVSSVANQVIKNTNEMIYIPRIVQPLNITKRVLLVIPPLINRQNGFSDSFKTLKKFILSISAKLIIIAEETTCSEIAEFFSKSDAYVSYAHVHSWKKICGSIGKMIKNDDMIVQMLARPGKPAWRLSFEKMTLTLRHNFDKNNLIVIYPYSYEEGDFPSIISLREEMSLLKSIPEPHFYLNCKSRQPENVFDKICAEHIPENKEKIYKELTEVLNEYPIELTPEIVLIHTRTQYVASSELYIAVHQTGFDIPNNESNPKIMILFLSPLDLEVQKHLNILSEISKLMMMKPFVNDLTASDSYVNLMRRIEGYVLS